MNLTTTARIWKRGFLALTLTGMVLYGGGCSFRTIGAYLLSDFLTGGGSSLTDSLGSTSGLDSMIGDLVGAAT